MAEATSIEQAASGNSGREAVVRYYGGGSAMAEDDTIGIKVDTTVNLQTVPAGGQTLFEAADALAVLVTADGYPAVVSKNSPADVCLVIDTGGADLTLPVFTIA